MKVKNVILALVLGLIFGNAVPVIASLTHFNGYNRWGDDTYKIDGCRNTPFNAEINGSDFYYRAQEAGTEMSAPSPLDFVYTSPQPCVANGVENTSHVPDDNTWIGDHWHADADCWDWFDSTPSGCAVLGEADMLIDVSNGDILRGWVKINDDNNIPWNTTNSAVSGKYDLEGVMLHEIGHVAGFGHFGCTETPVATMCNSFPYYKGSKQMSTLTQHEDDDMAARY